MKNNFLKLMLKRRTRIRARMGGTHDNGGIARQSGARMEGTQGDGGVNVKEGIHREGGRIAKGYIRAYP
jgi:hypothetical protein